MFNNGLGLDFDEVIEKIKSDVRLPIMARIVIKAGKTILKKRGYDGMMAKSDGIRSGFDFEFGSDEYDEQLAQPSGDDSWDKPAQFDGTEDDVSLASASSLDEDWGDLGFSDTTTSSQMEDDWGEPQFSNARKTTVGKHSWGIGTIASLLSRKKEQKEEEDNTLNF